MLARKSRIGTNGGSTRWTECGSLENSLPKRSMFECHRDKRNGGGTQAGTA